MDDTPLQSETKGGSKMTANQEAMIRKMRLAGCGYGQIGKATGLSKNTVTSFCRRKGIESNADNHLLICTECGKIEPRSAIGRKRVFCSDKCRFSWYNKHRNLTERNAEKKVCPACGQTFFCYASTKRKYCSHACYIADRFGKGRAYDKCTELP